MVRPSLYSIANGFMALLRRTATGRNVGEDLLEWPERSRRAAALLASHLPAADSVRIADYGCGRQTLKRFLSGGWSYTPFDWRRRSDDTIVVDLNRGRPDGNFDAIVCLGVLEYLDDPLGLLAHAIGHAPIVIFSYNGPTNADRRREQGWRNGLELDALEHAVAREGARVLEKVAVGDNEWLYLAQRGPLP